MNSRLPASAARPDHPTRVRYLVVACCAAASVLLYLDRACLSFVGNMVQVDLSLTDTQLDLAFSAFFLTYALCQVPAGWLSDRFGARRMMVLYLTACGLCTALMGAAQSFLGLVLARLALGGVEAGGYPTAAGLLRRWIPVDGRGRASSFIGLGARLGGAATPLATAVLLVALLPRGQSALLAPEDLLDLPRLARALAADSLGPDNADTASRRFLARLDPPVRAGLAEMVAAEGGCPTGLEPAAVAASLNCALADPELTAGLEFSGASLPREARRLLGRPVNQRSAGETARLNRLVLEAAAPGSVRQLYAAGWRKVFLIYAAVGLSVAVLFWLVVRERAAVHPWANQAEAALVPDAQPPIRGQNPLPLLIRSRTLWLSAFCQFCINFGWAFLITRLPSFLEDRFGVSIEERGLMAMMPLLAGATLVLLGGWLTDRLTHRLGRRWGRALPLGTLPLLGTVAFLACAGAPSAWTATACLALVAIATDMASPAIWALTQDISRQHVGTVLGWGNMWGNLGAALSTPLLSQVRTFGGWEGLFVACAAAFACAGMAGFLIDARQAIEPAEEPGSDGQRAAFGSTLDAHKEIGATETLAPAASAS
ncbi:MAG: MFS transporter [Planctomycetia bacterium]|nr:MFS transporter [Planctomycetia bacterium]